MSHNRIIYRIYPDNESPHTNEQWLAADRYINGFAHSYDKKEAFAIAKLAAKNCRFPFVVAMINLPSRKNKLCDAFVF